MTVFRLSPAVDALGRRLAKKGALPRINPTVDSSNTVSVTHGLQSLDHVTGDVDRRYADGTETLLRLGSTQVVAVGVSSAVIGNVHQVVGRANALRS
ncbi:hypothetical protein [Nonomuraea sp. NPDC003804]|uniref:hypothetical protein n=1 Tax=Nonomuraea sp. NPDC003804 TaxID=3154547 RepID=UPI0033B2BF69